MSNLINKVQQLSLMKKNTVLPIYQGDDVTYLCRTVSGYAVAIPFNDERDFEETFVGITLSTNILNVGSESFKVLYLNMIDTGDLKKFSYIGAEFISIENRQSILDKPFSWVDEWKNLFGDSVKKMLVTDVVAELISLREIYKIDKTAKWLGPKDGTHDIVAKDFVVEVKSTTHKTNSYVSINSRFQLNADLNEKLYFVRLEVKPYALTINKLVEELVELGYSETELEENLKELGYKKGKRLRSQSFEILGINSYEVNAENFPIIKLAELNKLAPKGNIVGFKLNLDLTSVDGTTIL